MKQRCRLLTLLLLILALTSCQNQIPGFSSLSSERPESVPVETVPETGQASVTDPIRTEPAAEPETEPLPNPYGIFTYAADTAPAIPVSSPHAILIDAATNEILYLSGDPFEPLYPASVTKLLTILVAEAHCPDLTTVFTPGDELSLVAKDGSIAYIKSHHKLTLEMLFEGMLLPSGGDAAYVTAAGVGRIIAGRSDLGGAEAVAVFMAEMNRYATEELGLTGSRFANPDGYFDENHYTTLRDIMTVARRAMEDPVIMKYAGLHYDKVRYASGHTNAWTNTNALLNPKSPYYCAYATGLKTGTLEAAGKCLVSTAQKDGRTVLVGIFGAADDEARYTDTLRLIELGLGQ